MHCTKQVMQENRRCCTFCQEFPSNFLICPSPSLMSLSSVSSRFLCLNSVTCCESLHWWREGCRIRAWPSLPSMHPWGEVITEEESRNETMFREEGEASSKCALSIMLVCKFALWRCFTYSIHKVHFGDWISDLLTGLFTRDYLGHCSIFYN